MAVGAEVAMKRKVNLGAIELKSGERKIVEVNGRSIGIFNVNGDYYAMHNRCPHMGGALCAGPVTGTTLTTSKIEFEYGRKDEIVRCGWHDWEFDIKSGACLVNKRMRAKTYTIIQENGQLILHI